MAAFRDSELVEFRRALKRVFKVMQKLSTNANTEREKLFLQIGMSASHIEESMVMGDAARAKAHLLRMTSLMKQL